MIAATRLEFAPESVNYVWEVQHAREMRTTLPDGYCPYDFVWLMDNWKVGATSMYMPVCDGDAMGICFGETVGNEFHGHYLIFRKYWGPQAAEAVSACIDVVKAEEGVTRFVGTIPAGNRRSIAFARRLGFDGNEILNIDRYGDCVRLTKEI